MREKLALQVAAVCKELFDIEIKPELARTEEQFGDYATNVALQLAKDLGKAPREIAEAIATKLQGSEGVKKVDVAGPGFINLTLSDQMLADGLAHNPEPILQGQTIVIETNNPNPFKAIHIGHAFNAVLGDTIANLLELAGATIYRVSYHGDVGLHVGKSMYSLLKYVDGNIDALQAIPEAERNSFMSRMYAEGSAAYKDNPEAKAEIDALAEQSFTREDRLYAEVYDICKAWSFEQIDQTVSRLGSKPTVQRFLESDADLRGVEIVKKHVPDVFQESGGAIIFKGSEHGSFDNVFVTASGRGLYAARDLGLMQLKTEQYHPSKSYIVTAEEQRDYFKGVIAAAELAMPEQKGVTVNISTGTVKLTTGKMSSRSGDVVEISWLFDQIAAATSERGGEPTDDAIIGVLRYGFLKVRIGSDVIFDVNEAVSLQGNSGVYLQYAHARACSILAKSGHDGSMADEFEEGERRLLRKLTEYPEVVNEAIRDLTPHHICNYLHELAQEFNRFYEGNRVIGDPRESQRLGLIKSYADTLNKGLEILGIPAPETM